MQNNPVDIHAIAKTINCLQHADDDTLNMICKHIQDVIVLTRIIRAASTQILGVQHVTT